MTEVVLINMVLMMMFNSDEYGGDDRDVYDDGSDDNDDDVDADYNYNNMMIII